MLIVVLLSAHTKLPSANAVAFSVKPLPGIIFFEPVVSKMAASMEETANTNKYTVWNLAGNCLSEKAFDYAMKGYQYLGNKKLISNKKILSSLIFSKSSTQKRLYVIDICIRKILFNTLRVHGKNSGNEYATNFSNQDESTAVPV